MSQGTLPTSDTYMFKRLTISSPVSKSLPLLTPSFQYCSHPHAGSSRHKRIPGFEATEHYTNTDLNCTSCSIKDTLKALSSLSFPCPIPTTAKTCTHTQHTYTEAMHMHTYAHSTYTRVCESTHTILFCALQQQWSFKLFLTIWKITEGMMMWKTL